MTLRNLLVLLLGSILLAGAASAARVGNNPPTANFSYTTSGEIANFTDTSTDSDGTIVSHVWTFGDGSTSNSTNPSHGYKAVGTYSVTERVLDNGGATSTKTISVAVSNNNPPTANFVYTTHGLTANFTDISSDSDGTIASHAWTFGDGGTSMAANPSHTYAANNFYSVSETVTDNGGATSTKTVSVGVSNIPPTANFSYATSGLTANFTDTSTDSDGTIASHAWAFGDGGSSTAANPGHTYATNNTYPVSETVTDNKGATNTKTSLVAVSDGITYALPDQKLYTSYAFSNSFTYVGLLVCGSTPGSTGCYGDEGTNLGPFGHIGAMIEGNESVDTSTNTVTRYIYIVDQAVAGGTGTKLYIYKKTDVVGYSTDTVTVTLANSMDLSLVGGTTAKTFLAANAGFLFIGTNQSPFALKVNKSTLAISQIDGYLPENLTAITADKYGYVSITSESGAFSGVAVFDPDGNLVPGGAAALMLDTTTGYSTSGGPVGVYQPTKAADRMQLKFKKPPSK